jgi:hypothetical protein
MIWTTKTIIAMAVLCCLLGYAALSEHRAAGVYKDQRDTALQSLADADTLRRNIQKQVLVATAAASAARAQLKEVLDASPEVRDAATPVPVRDSLCATLRCK